MIITKCPQCKHENPNGARFCMECGAKLENLCPKCGAKLPSEAKFCMECGARLGEASAKAAIPKLEDMHAQLQSFIPDELARKYMTAEQQAAGENRPITALFADISGFTPLSATKSSEDMFQLVQDCFKRLVGIVARYEGSISGFRGDGLLALFGAPILHENDAERAILAGIDMRNMMQDKGLQVSIGINTAMMTVGEIQTELHKEYTAYGTDVNLAARLQQAAEPGQILVGAGTHRLTYRAFDFETIYDLMLRGFSQPVKAYSVQQVKLHPEKLRGIEGLRARMIGREREFTDIKESADSLMSGRGSIATIIGEAGLGKSRLALELKEYLVRLETRDLRPESGKPDVSSLKSVACLEGRCLSIGQAVSYWPFLDMLRTYLNLRDTDTEPQIAEKIRKSISSLFPQRQDDYLPFLGHLMSVKFGDELDNRLRYFTPEQIRHQTLMRLKDIFAAISHTKPLLLILEDLHWADDLSLDLIVLLMDELTANPLMLLCIYRPEQEHRCWQLGNMAFRKCPDRYTEISLKKLSQTQSRQLVESLLEIDNLPEDTKRMILTRSEGNPFFIEELIRSLIDRELIYREGDRWKARDEIKEIDVPDTIQSVLLSRVDRLNAETKYVLQCASVIGRLFKYRLLDHLARHERDLEAHLTELESKDLINAERTVPELEYAFKHALTQEATYQSILERKRREFHLQVAQGIEKLYSGRLEEYYEELAEHYSKSDEEKALEYLIKAGDKAKDAYANQQAIGYYTRAMNIANQFPEKGEQKLSILDSLGDVYYLIGKLDEALQSYEPAIKYSKGRGKADIYRKIAGVYSKKLQYDFALKYLDTAIEELGDDTRSVEMARIYNVAFIYNNYEWSGYDFDKALDYGFKAISITEGTEHKMELAETYMNMASTYSYKDNYEKAIMYAQKVLNIAQNMGNADLLGTAHQNIAYIYNRNAKYEMAIGHLKECIELCKKTGNIPLLVNSYRFLGGAYYHVKDYESAIKSCKEGIKLGEGRELLYSTGYILVVLSWTYRAKGEWDEAIMYAKEALEIRMTLGHRNTWMADEAYEVLIDVYRTKGEWDEAIKYAQEVLDESTRGTNWIVPQAYKVLIDAYLAKGELDKALYYPRDFVNLSLDISGTKDLYNPLSFAEEIYEKMGKGAEFVSFCHEIMEENTEKLKEMKLTQWYLEPKELSGQFTQIVFSDEFDGSVLNPEWQWVNPRGDCSYNINSESFWLVIRAASGYDLYPGSNLNAPRLIQGISGDFAIETKMASAEKETPTVGGLLVWKDKDNYIRFERGMHGTNEIGLSGCIKGGWGHFGRGMLVSDTIYMQIERIGDTLSAYCSKDGEKWLTCGEVSFPVEEPVQVGIHAIGGLGSRGGSVATATRFDYFRVLRRTS